MWIAFHSSSRAFWDLFYIFRAPAKISGTRKQADWRWVVCSGDWKVSDAPCNALLHEPRRLEQDEVFSDPATLPLVLDSHLGQHNGWLVTVTPPKIALRGWKGLLFSRDILRLSLLVSTELRPKRWNPPMVKKTRASLVTRVHLTMSYLEWLLYNPKLHSYSRLFSERSRTALSPIPACTWAQIMHKWTVEDDARQRQQWIINAFSNPTVHISPLWAMDVWVNSDPSTRKDGDRTISPNVPDRPTMCKIGAMICQRAVVETMEGTELALIKAPYTKWWTEKNQYCEEKVRFTGVDW